MGKSQNSKKDLKTFTVPFDVEEIQENMTLNTNIYSKESKCLTIYW